MKFNLVDGYIKFITHTVEVHNLEHSFYDEESKNNFTQRLDDKNIEYTVTEHEYPSEEILQHVEGKKFNTIAEAQAFIDTGIEPVTLETLIEVVADFIGGAL